jgi:MFS family permease
VYNAKHHTDSDPFCKYNDPVISFFVAALFLAGIFGAFLGSWTNKWRGRRPTMMLGGACFLVGAVLMCAASHTAMLVIGRVCLGIGVGICVQCGPLFLSELAPYHLRGMFNVQFQVRGPPRCGGVRRGAVRENCLGPHRGRLAPRGAAGRLGAPAAASTGGCGAVQPLHSRHDPFHLGHCAAAAGAAAAAAAHAPSLETNGVRRPSHPTPPQLFITIGILVAQVINYLTQHMLLGWRISLGLAGAPALLLLLGCLFVPETPNSLVSPVWVRPPLSLSSCPPPLRSRGASRAHPCFWLPPPFVPLGGPLATSCAPPAQMCAAAPRRPRVAARRAPAPPSPTG